jgi:hypothetical protein
VLDLLGDRRRFSLAATASEQALQERHVFIALISTTTILARMEGRCEKNQRIASPKR